MTTARWAAALSALLLGGCYECRLTPAKYMCVAPQPALLPSDSGGLGVQQQAACMAPDAADAQLELLATVLSEDRHIRTREEFIREVSSRPPVLEWSATGPFMCGSVLAVGCTSEPLVRVDVADCVGHTALAHELVHVYLLRTSRPDGDPGHTLPIWDSESHWMLRSHMELCDAI